MADRNAQLKSALGSIATPERVAAVNNIPSENTVNHQGYAAYSLSDELRLVSMLNTLKLQPQCYRSENEQMSELQQLIERIGMVDPYFVCQAIVWSRCLGEGMRSINHIAATLVAPFISGRDYAKRFYGQWNKKTKSGGCVFRTDDMSEIKDVWMTVQNGKSLPNAMKKGFASVLENLDTYQLAKYKKSVIDIANLVHPNSSKSSAEITVENEIMKTLDALMNGINVTADTWESAQSEAGQEVAKAVREGKLTKTEAERVLTQAKADNWQSLLEEDKLGIIAALRNIRNIMKEPRKETIDAWCALVTNKTKIKNSLILPIHFDLAHSVVSTEFNDYDYANDVKSALEKAYEIAVPNIANIMTGKTCIIMDCSGSMGSPIRIENDKNNYNTFSYLYARKNHQNSCAYKASLIAATFAKATGADIVQFGTRARFKSYDKNKNVFALAQDLLNASEGGTDPRTAFDLITDMNKVYDRIIFISDNEMNGAFYNSYYGCSNEYKRYIHNVCNPYIYCIDLAAYGTTPLNSDKVKYFVGYGPSLYESISQSEFNPEAVLDQIKNIVI